MVIKPQTGEIRAMVGGRDYRKSQFNRVAQAKRQPGSVFKPFVYLAALTHGSASGREAYNSTTFVEDAPFTWSFGRQNWAPENYKHQYYGWVTLSEAMEKSLNAATARIAQDVGIGRVREMAYRMGIQSRLPLLPSLALGAVEVTPLEMAGAFSALANNGIRTHLLSIKNVLDRNGVVLEKRNIRVKRVISPQVAFDMNNMLRGVVDRGTARGARRLGFTRPAAGKTGHHQRRPGRLVRGIHARPAGIGMGRFRPSVGVGTAGFPGGSADLDGFHEKGHPETSGHGLRDASGGFGL